MDTLKLCLTMITVALLASTRDVAAFDLFELVFGPRLRDRSDRVDRKVNERGNVLSDAEYHVRNFGYPFEQHEVITEDGYVLMLHRIPHSNRTDAKKRRPAVLLHHGIFGASENWMFRGPNVDLCYILSDIGYDVWFSNSRGNYHSRKHISLDPNTDTRYWNFSYHEMGYYDLPASIDHILNETNQKSLFYVGYSMGSTVGYIMLSTRPEYNKKIRFMVNFAGTGIVAHRLAPHLKVVFNTIPAMVNTLREKKINELFPRRHLISELLETVCQDKSPLQAICLTIIYLTVGLDDQQFNTSYVHYIFKYYPSGASINTLLHYYQMFTLGNFAPFNVPENSGNFEYINKTLPEYDLSKITVPISLHYGDGDVLVTKQDNVAIARRLKNVVGIFRVPFRYFNHLDFIWSSDSKRLLYDQVAVLMEKYR